MTQRRLAVASILLAALAGGCGRQPLKTDGGAGTGGDAGQAGAGGTFTPTRKVDMLFVIDDSSSVRLLQDNLNRNFPTFLSRLSDPPGLPDLRIAVISIDLGAGDGSIAGCNATGGKNGIFQYTARGTCTATGLDPGATYIADTGTSFIAGQTLSTSDDKWLRKVGAEQKLFDGVTISGSIGETPSGAASKSLSAGFKRSW